jgi:putative sigma-54 modulation protein
MQIQFTGHNVEVTPALRSFTEEKLGKLEHHFDQIMQINIVFNVEKLLQIVEGTIFIAKNEIYAHAESENMYTSIDQLVDKLDSQLSKQKGKKQEKIKEKMRKSSIEKLRDSEEESDYQ